jgi:hypothetical protein
MSEFTSGTVSTYCLRSCVSTVRYDGDNDDLHTRGSLKIQHFALKMISKLIQIHRTSDKRCFISHTRTLTVTCVAYGCRLYIYAYSFEIFLHWNICCGTKGEEGG